MLVDTILDAIGNTPTVKLHRLSADTGSSVYAKMESLNPGGSHKARIAYAMILDAQRKGILVRGSGQTILEPSGGNTGIGLAMAANLLGYKIVLVIPDNYSIEKQKLLRAFGAQIVLSDSRRGNNSHGEKAIELQFENPDFVMLNQQLNPANPEVHRLVTGPEIISAFGQTAVNYFVGGVGTGGHISGIGEALKAHWPALKIYGVEPAQCDLKNGYHAAHEIQGLSIGIIPRNMNFDILDGMIKVEKDECVSMLKKTMQTESISLGISSAANLVAVAKLAPHVSKGSVILTMVYDGVDSYLSYLD